jgi:predicted PurR-regulated permease PerM
MTEYTPSSSPRWGATTKLVVSLTAIVIVAAFLIRFQTLIIPVAFAFVLAYLFQPFASLLDRIPRISWRLSVGLTYILLILILASLLTLSGLGIVTQTQSLINLLQNSLDEVPTLLNDSAMWVTERTQALPIPTIDLSKIDLETITQDLLAYVQPLLGSTGQVIGSFASGAAGFFGWFAFVLLVSYFILSESGGLRENLLRFEVPGYAEDFKRLGQELGRIWNAFLRGQMIIFSLAFIFYFFVLSVLGVRYAIGLALLAGISKFLPYIGPAMVWVALALVSYFQPDKLFGMEAWMYTVLVILIALIFDQILDGLITPRILADALSVHPAAVLVSALIFADLIGILGIIIAAPMLATFVLFGRYMMRKMLDRDPWHDLGRRKGAPPLKILETVRTFFGRLPLFRKAAQAELESDNAPEERDDAQG